VSEVLKKSLASWREAHGFGILCIISPAGEHFVVAAQGAADHATPGLEAWAGMSEPQLREYLAERRFSDADSDDAIQLAREWATTITGSSVVPEPPKSS
jgi:hypothetical protein